MLGYKPRQGDGEDDDGFFFLKKESIPAVVV